MDKMAKPGLTAQELSFLFWSSTVPGQWINDMELTAEPIIPQQKRAYPNEKPDIGLSND